MRADRTRLVVALTAVLLNGVAGSTVSYVAAAQCGTTQKALGTWSAVDPPAVPSLPAALTSSVISASMVGQDSSVLLATDGVAVYRSTDGGCRWSTTFTLGAADYPALGGAATAYSISNIANGHSSAPAARQDVYLALSPNPLNAFTFVTLFGAAPPEFVAVSHDGGQTFAIVQPSPSAADPIVPECLSAPTAFLVPPTEARTVYLQCGGGLAQQVAETQLAGGSSYVYRSLDGGQSWSLIALPSFGYYGEQWFLPGPKAKELWVAGQWSAPNGGGDYVAVWHSTDNGAHWSMSKPYGRPGVGIGAVGIAVDMSASVGGERVVVYAPIGAFATNDGGKHWAKLGGLVTRDGPMRVLFAFVLKHSVFVVALPTGAACRSPGTLVLRYANPRAQPTQAKFPTRWGNYWDWGLAGSFVTADGTATAFGLASFCSTAGSPASPKLLSFRIS